MTTATRSTTEPAAASTTPTAWLSIIIPARNEAGRIPAVLDAVAGTAGIEVIVVDGHSSDETARVARTYGADVLVAPPSRAGQMNAGAAKARGDVLLFLHADTIPPPGFDAAIRGAMDDRRAVAGAFRLRIDGPDRSLRLIERCIAWRTRARRMPYGDQGIFIRAADFRAIGGFPDLPIMEDYELMRRLRRRGPVHLADGTVLTSARRWQRAGVWRTTVFNQLCVVAYRVGIAPRHIARWRESSL